MTDVTAIHERLNRIEAFLPDLESSLLEMQQGDLGIHSKSTAVDLVTRADFESERRLCDFIRAHFPGDGIVAEEGSPTAEEAGRESAFRWILDPIDGTVNYANRLPGWAISIGLLHGAEPVGGIVSAPAFRERYRAVRGEGATRNGEPIRVNDHATLLDGLVVTGFPYDRAKRAEPLSRALENMLRICGGIRRFGAAALDFCYLADGRVTGYYEMSLKPWDAAAGSLIAREAGARITDLAGDPYDLFSSPGAITSNGRVHEELVRAARPMLDAVRIV